MKQSISLSLLFSVAIGLLIPHTLHAGGGVSMEPNIRDYNEREIDSLTNNSLVEVVVTATRTPKPYKDVPVVTRVLDSEDIRKTDATNIRGLLSEEVPGLEFGTSMTQEASLSMGGYTGNAILFLIDGERLAGETLDNVDYNRLNLEDVSQVEIVKGAASALYGANAAGGVINLISKDRTSPWHVNLNSRYSSFMNEWRSGANLSFNKGKWNSSTSFQYVKSETVQLTDVFDAESTVHQVFGGHCLNLKERLGFRVNGNLRFIGRGGYFNRISNRATYDDNYKDYNAGLRSEWQINDNSNLELSYGYDQYDKARYVAGKRTHNHDYSNRQHIVHGLFNRFWGLNCLTVGADYMYDHLTTYQFSANGSHHQTNLDLYAQFDWSPISWLNLVGSLREDYFSASRQNSVTGRLAIMFKPSLMTIRTSYAGGFRAPSLKELYMIFDMVGIYMIYGNPNLKPEKSHNFNLAIERNHNVTNGIWAGSYSLTMTGYYSYYANRIGLAEYPTQNSNEEGFIYANEDHVQVLGADINLRYKFVSGLETFGSFSWLNTIGRTIDSPFTQPRPYSATWRIGYEKRFSKNYQFYAAISGRYLSKPESKIPSGGAYSLWKLTFQQNVWRGIAINLSVDNLFNYKPKVYYWNSALTTGTSFSIGASLDLDTIFKK